MRVQVAGAQNSCLLYDFQDPLSAVLALALCVYVTIPR